MTRLRTRGILALAACLACGLLAAPAAQADHHEISVREVFPGSGTDAYVELQAYAAGQNLLTNHVLTTYTATGTATDCMFTGTVGNAANQMTVLIADSGGPANADLSCPGIQLSPAGGAVCWRTDIPPPVDCMSWGSFTGSVNSPAGTPAVSPPAGMALRRSIAAGNKNLLEPSDDTNNSAADFEVCPPNPRSNSAPIIEASCPGARGGGGGGTPNTKIKKRPKNKSDDDSPTFKFKSTESGSKFKCKLDRKKYKRCKSPKTYHGLDPGKHVFKVKAVDADGNADKTPAKDSFKVLR
jgi:hypothetical protein